MWVDPASGSETTQKLPRREPIQNGPPTVELQVNAEMLAFVRSYPKVQAESENRVAARNADEVRHLRGSVDRLNAKLTSLSVRIVELNNELDRERAESKKSDLINFWAGVAISIPIGVAINLVT
jgi:uncharacterized protein YlxW (UPF0749 family)